MGIPQLGGFALFANRQTSLIAELRALAGDACRVKGHRAVLLRRLDDLHPDLLGLLIRRALGWHWQ